MDHPPAVAGDAPHELYRVLATPHKTVQGMAHICNVCHLSSLFDEGGLTYYSCFQHADCRVNGGLGGFTICFTCLSERDFGQRGRPLFGDLKDGGVPKINMDRFPPTDRSVNWGGMSAVLRSNVNPQSVLNDYEGRRAQDPAAVFVDYDSDSAEQNLHDDRPLRALSSTINRPDSTQEAKAAADAERRAVWRSMGTKFQRERTFLSKRHLSDIDAQGFQADAGSLAASFDLRNFPEAYITMDPLRLTVPLKLHLGASLLFGSEYLTHTGFECDTVFLMINEDWDKTSPIHYSSKNVDGAKDSHGNLRVYGNGVHHADALASTRSTCYAPPFAFLPACCG